MRKRKAKERQDCEQQMKVSQAPKNEEDSDHFQQKKENMPREKEILRKRKEESRRIKDPPPSKVWREALQSGDGRQELEAEKGEVTTHKRKNAGPQENSRLQEVNPRANEEGFGEECQEVYSCNITQDETPSLAQGTGEQESTLKKMLHPVQLVVGVNGFEKKKPLQEESNCESNAFSARRTEQKSFSGEFQKKKDEVKVLDRKYLLEKISLVRGVFIPSGIAALVATARVGVFTSDILEPEKPRTRGNPFLGPIFYRRRLEKLIQESVIEVFPGKKKVTWKCRATCREYVGTGTLGQSRYFILSEIVKEYAPWLWVSLMPAVPSLQHLSLCVLRFEVPRMSYRLLVSLKEKNHKEICSVEQEVIMY
jgi:hypothetical protein